MDTVSAEKEVERLFRVLLKQTSFAGKAYAVGGFVRDEFLGREAKDLDVIVEVKEGARDLTHLLFAKFGGAISTPRQMGANYPIWQITFKENIVLNGEAFQTEGAIIEFADTMKESFPDELSRQREVEWGTLEEDIARRDFSVNMLLKDMTTGEIKDITGTSENDIRNGILRGHPKVPLDKPFSDDPLRMVRLIRFHCKYGWKIPHSVLKCVRRNAERIKIISAERITEELKKICTFGKLHKAIRLMKATNLLPLIFPEVAAMQGCKQHPKHHSEGDAFKHTMLVLSHAVPTFEGQVAALLHDIGKPATQEIKPDNITFYGHELVGADMAENILYRLKLDVKTIKHIKMLVKFHMRPIALNHAGEKGLRKFLRELDEQTVNDVLDLAEADAKGSLPPSGVPHNFLPELRARLKAITDSPFGVSNKPILDGKEIAELLEIKPGPIIGQVIEFLKEVADEHATQKKVFTKESARDVVIQKFKKSA